MGLNDFLWEVSDWTKSEQVSEYELLRSFGNLLTGRAKLWFTSNKHRFNTYSELIANLKLTFRHPDLDHFILLDIYQKRQQKNETFLEFFLDIEKKFKSLTAPVSEIEIVQAVRRNLRPEYKRALIGREMYDLYSLQIAGQEIDATNTYLFIKPQNTSQTNAVEITEKRSGGFNHGNTGRGPYSKSFTNKSPNANPNNATRQGYVSNQGGGSGKQWSRKESNQGNPPGKTPSKTSTEQKKPFAEKTKGGSKKPMNVESKIEEYVPLNDKFVCFNCRSQEHLTYQCTQPYKVHCQVCGFKGFPTHRCPFYAKKLCVPKGDRHSEGALKSIDEILFALGYDQTPDNELLYKPDLNPTSVLTVLTDNRPFLNISLFGRTVKAFLDSGSQKTLLSDKTSPIWRLSSTKILPSNLTLTSASGDPLPVAGRVNLPFTIGDKTRVLESTIVEDLPVDCIAGIDFFDAFDIHISMDNMFLFQINVEECPTSSPELVELSSEQDREINRVKSHFKPAMSDQLEVTSLVQHTIELKDEFKSVAPTRVTPFPYSPSIHKALNEEIDRLLALGVIEDSNSDWALNAVPIKKPNGSIRLCLDARKLNTRTKRDAYPLAHVGRILGRLGKTRYLSTIDLKDAFLQIPLCSESKPLTAFSFQGKGMFQYTRLPFSLTNSPATLSRLMDKILGAGALEPQIFVYLDDIIVASETFEEHIKLLEEVAKRLREANLSINLQKSQFCRFEVPFLGYLLSCDGLKPDPSKVQAILDFEAPKTIRQIRRFLGMVNYYRRFIGDFSEIPAPISDLLAGKPKIVRWTSEAEQAFRKIKERLITAPILANPDFDKEFSVQTDASDRAVAGVLTQLQEGSERAISFFFANTQCRTAELLRHGEGSPSSASSD